MHVRYLLEVVSVVSRTLFISRLMIYNDSLMNNPILTLFLTKVAVAGWRTGGRERCRGEPLYYRALSLVSRRAPCRHSVEGALLIERCALLRVATETNRTTHNVVPPRTTHQRFHF